MSHAIHEWGFQVLEGHLDTFGHMNHATYLQLFEQARWDLLTQRGFGLAEIQRQQIGPTILAVEVKYKRELLLREKVTVQTQCTSYKGKIGILTQQMFKEDGQEAAIITLTIALFDMKARKLMAPTQKWLDVMGLPAEA